MARPIRILSIDGGGIRGIIPGVVLTEIERRTGRRIGEQFDLIAGTSTGGILALGLTKPGPDGLPAYAASALLNLYVTEGRTIFPQRKWGGLRSLRSVLWPKFSRQGLDKVLARTFDQSRLSEAVTRVLVTCYALKRRKPLLLKSYEARERPDYDYLMADACRATSAAPTYFSPADIKDCSGGRSYSLVDGGVFSNNPALIAFLDARQWSPNSAIHLVSLGTGQSPEETRPLGKARNWGKLGWAQPVIELMFQTSAHMVHYSLWHLAGHGSGGRSRYDRFQVDLGFDTSSALDDAGSENVEALRADGERLVHLQDRELDDVCKRLSDLYDRYGAPDITAALR